VIRLAAPRSGSLSFVPPSRRGAPVALSFLLPGVANVFEELRVSAAIRVGGPWAVGDGSGWRSIHVERSLPDFELEHGHEVARDQYNVRTMDEARRTRSIVRGEHAGLSDLFVPIVERDRVPAILATGPFVARRPTSADALERWQKLTGKQGHPGDPEFHHYLSVSLSTLVLDGELLTVFERFLSRFALLLSGDARAESLLAEADALRWKLVAARSAELTWESVRTMIDERTAMAWTSPYRTQPLKQLGLTSVPERALVGLVLARPDADPVEELFQRDALQRACVELARSEGNAIAGQIGDYGVVFLTPDAGSGAKTRRKLLHLAERATALARRTFGLELYLGLDALTPPAPLTERFQAALGAAEAALSRRVRVVDSATATQPTSLLSDLRHGLAHLVEEGPAELPARFERYFEAVAVHCGYQLEPARGHLEAGLDDVAAALVDGGALDRKSYLEASEGLAKATRDARTLAEILLVYRRVIADMSEAAQRPMAARQNRSLRRAVAYIHRHYAEPLRRATVARIAGFAPSYFSLLFKRTEKMTFERYVQDLRIERAKQLLAGTDLGMRRVAELSGFRTRFYLGEVFKRAVGKTPLSWRAGSILRGSGPRKRIKPQP
jgi:AraC-like DNA-binding protein